MILSRRYSGEIIGTLGNFLGAGNLIVGLIVLGIVTVVSFIVVMTSAKRVSKVTANTTTNTLTSNDVASTPVAFCEAMYGVIKFVKGDAIFIVMALVIIVIGGVSIRGEDISIFILFAIGYGLVFLIPTLLIAFISGLTTSRVYESVSV